MRLCNALYRKWRQRAETESSKCELWHRLMDVGECKRKDKHVLVFRLKDTKGGMEGALVQNVYRVHLPLTILTAAVIK